MAFMPDQLTPFMMKKQKKLYKNANNFEVKERDDEYMWGSVYRYIKQLQKNGF